MKAALLREHVVKLCEQYDIGFEEKVSARGRAYHGKPRKGIRPRIVVPPIRGQVSYFTALHEIGHLRARGRSLYNRLDKEGLAWSWALDNAIVEPTATTWASIWRSLDSYAQWSRRRRGVTPEDVSPHFIRAVDRVLGALR